jgi:hypothetical protein
VSERQPTAAFQPHGGTGVESRGRVLVFRSQMHLNREEVRRLQHETASRLRDFAGKPWAILGIVDKAVLLTADAEYAAKQALPQMVALGLTAQAVVFLDPAERPLVEGQVTRIVNKAIPMRFFERVADAEAWLTSMIGAD